MRLDAFENGMLERRMTSEGLIEFQTRFSTDSRRAAQRRSGRSASRPEAAFGFSPTASSGRSALPRAARSSMLNGLETFSRELLDGMTHYWRGALFDADAAAARGRRRPIAERVIDGNRLGSSKPRRGSINGSVTFPAVT